MIELRNFIGQGTHNKRLELNSWHELLMVVPGFLWLRHAVLLYQAEPNLCRDYYLKPDCKSTDNRQQRIKKRRTLLIEPGLQYCGCTVMTFSFGNDKSKFVIGDRFLIWKLWQYTKTISYHLGFFFKIFNILVSGKKPLNIKIF